MGTAKCLKKAEAQFHQRSPGACCAAKHSFGPISKRAKCQRLAEGMQCPQGFYPVSQKFADQCCEERPGLVTPCNPVTTTNGRQEKGSFCADDALQNKPIDDGEQGPDVLDALQLSEVAESWEDAKEALAVETAVRESRDTTVEEIPTIAEKFVDLVINGRASRCATTSALSIHHG